MTADLFGEVAPPRRAMSSHQSAAGGKDEWLTPPWLLELLGPFDLDPCAPVTRPWNTAKRHYTIADDGLSRPWEGFVWCNPPYAHVGKWMYHMALHNNGIALLFARTETNAWHRWVWPHATAVLFLNRRLTFYHVNGQPGTSNSGAPSALVAYGPDAALRLADAEERLGKLVWLKGLTS